jgi:hypothetical protein
MKKPTWLPDSLSIFYLSSICGLSLMLSLTCILLETHSRKLNGITNAKSTTGFQFSWRFVPTMVAVIYSIFWVPVMKDVLRTEPWALLALPSGSKASMSLLRSDKIWLVEVFEAFWKRSNDSGGVRWAIILSILCSIGGSLVLNPLSAGLLAVENLNITSTEEFSTFKTPTLTPDFPGDSDTTFLSSISSLVYNVSSSSWLTDKYAALPYWPSTINNAPLSNTLSSRIENWSSTTTVFKVQLDCELQSSGNFSRNQQFDPIFTISDSKGCNATIPMNARVNPLDGGALWAQFNVNRKFELYMQD